MHNTGTGARQRGRHICPWGTKDCLCVEKRQMWPIGKWQFLKGNQVPLCWDELVIMLIKVAKRRLFTAGLQYTWWPNKGRDLGSQLQECNIMVYQGRGKGEGQCLPVAQLPCLGLLKHSFPRFCFIIGLLGVTEESIILSGCCPLTLRHCSQGHRILEC